MNRTKFLSLIGLSFISTGLISSGEKRGLPTHTGCDDPVTPPVPEGPFYKNEHLNRIDIAGGKNGMPIEYVFRVEDKSCKPIHGAIVDIWQCDAEGHYSDFKEENTVNQTWLRGYQATNRDGECKFRSIFPGWYEGRVTHIHAKVRIENKDVLTTNFFFPKEVETEVYRSSLYPRGENPLSVMNDFELKVDKNTNRHDTLVMHVTKHQDRLIASYTIAIV